MEKTKLVSRIFYFLLVGFVVAGMVWYAKTGHAFVSSKFLFFGTISTGIISAIFHVIYLIQGKKFKELKQSFLWLIISIVVVLALGYLAEL